LNVHNVSDVRQIEIHTAEPLIPGHSYRKVEIGTENLKKYKSPGSDQILAELIQAEGETVVSVIHKLINSIWNKEESRHQSKVSFILPIHKKGDKNDCNNYRGISLLSTSYIIVSNIFLSNLSPYIEEIIWEHKCGFRHNISTINQIFCILQLLEKKKGVLGDSTSAIDVSP
jgi:hypothetical protein